MNEWTIYHNPRCSKSRSALELLRNSGITPRIVEYLQTPPDAKTVKDLATKLGLRPRDLLRDNEDEYAKCKLDDPSLPDESVFAAIGKHPILLQRPIVVRGAHAVIARPPEKVRELM